jgi:Macrocin-O-methyltransferase (TylF)
MTEAATPKLSWPYRADMPQRYNGNYERYRARGGIVQREEFVRGFVDGPDGKRGDMARFYAFCLAFDQIMKDGIAGDLAELGVYRGHTAAVLAEFARRSARTLHLLDTFEGFNSADFKGADADKKMQFADTSLELVKERVGAEGVHYVRGYFPQTAEQLPPNDRYSLVHIDCDLYAPISAGLQYFYPRMTPGGFLIIHDYSSLHWDGAEKAIDEFFVDKPEFPIPLPDGAGSAVVRKGA